MFRMSSFRSPSRQLMMWLNSSAVASSTLASASSEIGRYTPSLVPSGMAHTARSAPQATPRGAFGSPVFPPAATLATAVPWESSSPSSSSAPARSSS